MTPATAKQPAVFFDRDGTLMEEVGYCGRPDQVRVLPGVAGALTRLREAGFRLFIVTNQSGIARGYYTEDAFHQVQAELVRQLGGYAFDGVYFCADAPGEPSECRKPAPGMVLAAARDHGLDLARSYFVGDKESDIECGRRAGTRTVLVTTGYGESHLDCRPDFVAKNVPGAADLILKDAAR